MYKIKLTCKKQAGTVSFKIEIKPYFKSNENVKKKEIYEVLF